MTTSTKHRRHGPTPARVWEPIRPAIRVIPPALASSAAEHPEVAAALNETAETWRNAKYVVTVQRREGGSVSVLSIRRDDRKAIRDWRDLQRIKNDIAGEDAEAVELFPTEKRLVDTANQQWLWVLPPGKRFPFGFNERNVSDEPDPRFPTSLQRPFDKEE
jgi:hypothetical protein